MRFVRERVPGSGPAAGLVAGVGEALALGAAEIVVLPADAPAGGPAAAELLSRLRQDAALAAVIGVDREGREQPLQLALRPSAARALVEAAGPGGGAGQSARRLLSALEPAGRCPLTPEGLWDIDTPEELVAWQLRTSPAVSGVLAALDRLRACRGGPLVVAIDGPSCSGKSTLAAALALRTGAAVLSGDDFYRASLPALDEAARQRMGDDQVVDAVIDWARLRAEALLPLRAGRQAEFAPYDWEAGDGRLAEPQRLSPGPVVLVEGVYSGRRELADLVDLSVYVGVDEATRSARYAERSDDPAWVRFWERGEAWYFGRLRPPASFDLQL